MARGKLIRILYTSGITASVAALVIVATVTASAESESARRPDIKILPGPAAAPHIPVGSIILRRAFPDHPLGGPPGREEPLPPGGGPPQEQPLPPGGAATCDKDVDLTSTIFGVVAVAAQDNVFCTSADIDVYVRDTKTYVVQAAGQEGAWTHTEVTDPTKPVILGQFVWNVANTYTPDIKAFRQGARDYIVMALERLTIFAACGVIIYDVTTPATPAKQSQFIGSDWCDTHNVFVEINPITGDGELIYATADNTNDLRVLDIGGTFGGTVGAPLEIGRYTAPTADNDNYVHDVTVVNHGPGIGVRAYLAYWDSGVVVLNVDDPAAPQEVVGPNEIDPPGFLAHHAFPTADGDFVFIQDEFLDSAGDEPIQIWDITNPVTPFQLGGLVLGTDVPVNPAHNLEIRYDIDPNRLYVGWYKLGLQAFDFDALGFTGTGIWHQAQTEATDGAYDGAWGVRLAKIAVDDGFGGTVQNLYAFQSDRRYGLIVDCAGNDDGLDACGAAPPPPENQPPVANAGPDQTVILDKLPLQLDASASSDPDGTIASYAWSILSAPKRGTPSLTGAGTATPWFDTDRQGTYEVELVVTDNKGASASDTVVITVQKPPKIGGGSGKCHPKNGCPS